MEKRIAKNSKKSKEQPNQNSTHSYNSNQKATISHIVGEKRVVEKRKGAMMTMMTMMERRHPPSPRHM